MMMRRFAWGSFAVLQLANIVALCLVAFAMLDLGRSLQATLGIRSSILGTAPPKEEEVVFADGHLFELPVVLANLADSPGGHVVRFVALVDARGSQVRRNQLAKGAFGDVLKDSMIRLVSTKTMDDLRSPVGVETFKAELGQVVAKVVFQSPDEGQVSSVLFRELLVQ